MTGEAVELSIRPASLMSRAVACAIDAFIYTIVYIALLVSIIYFVIEYGLAQELLVNSLIIIFMAVTTIMVPCTVEILTRGRSLGKLVMGLRIVREDGGAISFRHAFLRALIWDFEVLSSGGGIAALAGFLSPRTKRLGDMLAGTIAVSERPRKIIHRPLPVPPQLHQWAQGVDLTPLPPGLMYRLTQFLDTSTKNTAESRLERAIELATEANPYVAPPPPEGTHPEDFLVTVVELTRTTQFHKLRKAEATAHAFANRVGSLPYSQRV